MAIKREKRAMPGNPDADTVNMSRRFFFKRCLAGAIGLAEEVQGKAQMPLQDISRLPDEIVRKMIPVLSAGDHYRIEKGCILLKDRESTRFFEFHRMDSVQASILKNFDGSRTLEEIATLLQEGSGLDAKEPFQQVRHFFTTLAERSICHPLHAHERE